MDDVNLVSISGRLVKDPELRKTPQNVSVLDFIIVSNRWVAAKDEGKEDQRFPTYIKVTLWFHNAEYWAKELKKGDKVWVMGQLADDNYVIKETNQTTRGRLKIDQVKQVAIVEYAREPEPVEDPQ